MPDLTRGQVEAMDETMTFQMHRVFPVRSTSPSPAVFAPGVIEKHERKTWKDVALMVFMYLGGTCILAGAFKLGAMAIGAAIEQASILLGAR